MLYDNSGSDILDPETASEIAISELHGEILDNPNLTAVKEN
jgi:hypothetical protein